jgi:hypothetical protein
VADEGDERVARAEGVAKRRLDLIAGDGAELEVTEAAAGVADLGHRHFDHSAEIRGADQIGLEREGARSGWWLPYGSHHPDPTPPLEPDLVGPADLAE